MSPLYLVLYILAFISFVLAAFGAVRTGKINLIALGLALWVLVFVIQGMKAL